ncbi:MAG: protein translocase subunit SecF, partial [Dehalococcoidales bacterium]
MFDIIGNRLRFILVAGVVVLACAVFLLTYGLKAGIEFSSGSMMTVGFEETVEQADLKGELAGLGYAGALIQQIGDDDFLIRLPELTGNEKTELQEGLVVALGNLQVKEFDAVSPMVAGETTRNAAIAVSVAALGILLYIAWAFRRMPNPFRYGACAIVALLHDTLVALGVFAILGGILGWEINLMFVTGILAVIGYSVNNTVVVFDRIRENLTRNERYSFGTVVNSSLVETISRSLNTSLTTLFVVISLLLFVGPAIQNFAIVLMVGIIAGTYSSL